MKDLILKELETAYERKKKALSKGMTKDEMKGALRNGHYRILFPEEDEDLSWYDLIRFTAEEDRQEALKDLEVVYRTYRVDTLKGILTMDAELFMLKEGV